MTDIPDVPATPRRTREATRQSWAGRLARFGDSGLSVLDFCRQEGIAPQCFYYWRRKLADPAVAAADAPEFLPVRLAPAASPVELVLPGGATLRLSPGCDLAFVRALVLALAGSEPC
jgi:transposase-like protein